MRLNGVDAYILGEQVADRSPSILGEAKAARVLQEQGLANMTWMADPTFWSIRAVR